MRKTPKRFLCIALSLAMVLIAIPSAVFAEEMPSEYKEQTKDNYWAELNWYKDTTYKGVIPKYLNDYFANSRVKWANRLNEEYFISFVPNTGISSSSKSDKDELDLINQLLSTYSKDEPHREPNDPALNRWQGGKQWNPYNFNYVTDVLTEGTTDYNARADIRERGLSSTEVARHNIGDTINLDFNIDLSMLKKTTNTWFLSLLNSEFPAYYMMKDNMPETAITQSDGQLVFVLDLPKGLDSTDATEYKLSGLDGFDLSVTKENGGRRIVVKARLRAPANYEMLKDVFAKIQKVNSVTLNIDGLKVTSEVETNKNSTLTGYAYGAYEYINTTDNNAIINQDGSNVQEDNRHHFSRYTIVFASKQLASGKDEAGDPNKPELITYSLRVNQNKVSFMNGSETHAVVNVESGKAIDTDSLTDQSMPADPSKAGYTFKEWNTAMDGSGAKFTGSTVVNDDMTVYAIYTKNAAPNKDKKPNKPGKLANPNTGDSSNIPPYLALMGLIATLAFTVYTRKKIR